MNDLFKQTCVLFRCGFLNSAQFLLHLQLFIQAAQKGNQRKIDDVANKMNAPTVWILAVVSREQSSQAVGYKAAKMAAMPPTALIQSSWCR